VALKCLHPPVAAEILLEGRVSKAADVYAFGITMWEMYTGRRVFEGIPRALLGHQITKVRHGPVWSHACMGVS
jgi:serine/threonine protein kinase